MASPLGELTWLQTDRPEPYPACGAVLGDPDPWDVDQDQGAKHDQQHPRNRGASTPRTEKSFNPDEGGKHHDSNRHERQLEIAALKDVLERHREPDAVPSAATSTAPAGFLRESKRR